MSLKGILEQYMEAASLEEKQLHALRFAETLREFRIVIYGAGAAGSALLRSLRTHGAEPLFFVDRRWRECETMDGVAVKAPEALAEVNRPDTLVILAINAAVIRTFNQGPTENIQKYCSNADVIHTAVHVNSLLQFVRCYENLNCGKPFNLAKCLDCGAETGSCKIYREYLFKIAPGRKILTKMPSKKFDWFGYIMGQYCSLKCKDCCEHAPYFKNPVFSDGETILSDCAKIAASCEFLRYIELVGGEPLLHPQLRQVLEGLLRIENVGYVKIFTNGTVPPNDNLLDILENPRIVVNLSNYTVQAKGVQLKNIRRTQAALEKREIRYIYSESKEWTDWGGGSITGTGPRKN